MASAGGLAVCISLLHSLTACGMALALGLALLAAANPPARALLQRLGTINIFIVFLWCVTPLTTPGTPLAQWGMLTVSAEGVRLALLVSIKSNAIACIFLALVATMNAPTAGHALERLHCPPKLRFPLFFFTARYVSRHRPGNWHTLLVAARLRGFSPAHQHAYLPHPGILAGSCCWCAVTSALCECARLMVLAGIFPAISDR
jgi:hypothetical protein